MHCLCTVKKYDDVCTMMREGRRGIFISEMDAVYEA